MHVSGPFLDGADVYTLGTMKGFIDVKVVGHYDDGNGDKMLHFENGVRKMRFCDAVDVCDDENASFYLRNHFDRNAD